MVPSSFSNRRNLYLADKAFKVEGLSDPTVLLLSFTFRILSVDDGMFNEYIRNLEIDCSVIFAAEPAQSICVPVCSAAFACHGFSSG